MKKDQYTKVVFHVDCKKNELKPNQGLIESYQMALLLSLLEKKLLTQGQFNFCVEELKRM